MSSSWLADGRDPFPDYTPEYGEVVGVVCWRPKRIEDGELEQIMETTRIWLGLAGYTVCALPATWKRRRKAQSFNDWWKEMVQQWAEEKRTEGGSE